jgi:sec-independent protein translocase protein TatC
MNAREPNDPDKHQMTIWEHLDELRSRILKMLVAFLLGAILSWWRREDLLEILTAPFVQGWQAGKVVEGKPELVFLSPAALFIAYVRLSALSGVVFAMPIMLYQVWAFVAPGLYSREKRLAIPFVVSSCGLFAGGGYFGWKVAFPIAFEFFLGMAGRVGSLQVKPTVTVSDYLDFVTNMLLAFGLMAELPVLVFFLSIAGIVTHKHLIKFFRYFIVIAFVIAAVVTPPDPLSQLLLACPLILLYGVSIGVAYVFARKRKDDATNDDKRNGNHTEPPSKAAE